MIGILKTLAILIAFFGVSSILIKYIDSIGSIKTYYEKGTLPYKGKLK